jgi:lipopolysaccharide export system permease protein
LKILDRYILTSFLKTFFSVFTILIFIFILQSVWLFVKELAGKDLDLIIVFKFLIYLLPTLVPLILPLTILLTSIMIFGNFAENYEFAAMKSAGISLQRAMRGVSLFILLLSITTFFFANNVVPWGEYKSRNLRRQIAVQSPKLLIAEGQFNSVGNSGITIKVDKKYGEEENLLENVTVFLTEKKKKQYCHKSQNWRIISI